MFMTPPKTIYRQQQPTRLGPLFQTPSVNGLGHSASSTLALVTTHHNFLSYAHCFNWPVLLLTPLSPIYNKSFWSIERRNGSGRLPAAYSLTSLKWQAFGISRWRYQKLAFGIGRSLRVCRCQDRLDTWLHELALLMQNFIHLKKWVCVKVDIIWSIYRVECSTHYLNPQTAEAAQCLMWGWGAALLRTGCVPSRPGGFPAHWTLSVRTVSRPRSVDHRARPHQFTTRRRRRSPLRPQTEWAAAVPGHCPARKRLHLCDIGGFIENGCQEHWQIQGTLTLFLSEGTNAPPRRRFFVCCTFVNWPRISRKKYINKK